MPDNTPNLADFDTMGAPTPPVDPQQPAAPQPPKKQQPPHKPMNIKKVGLGCLFVAVSLFALMIVAMVLGLAAGDAAINSFGFDPTSFKNWTVGLVNLVFGSIALAFIVALIVNIIRRLLAPKGETDAKHQASKHAIIHGVIFLIVVVLWVLAFSYLQKFINQPSEFKVEILSDPINTLGITSPLTVNLSGELVEREFGKQYDIVSYEWDRESDGYIDATGKKVQLYFPHGGKDAGIFHVSLVVRMQPRGTIGETVTKEYQKVISIAKQEMYGEIIADRVSGEVPLTTRLDASEIKDPHGADILNYSWDVDGDSRSDFDGPMYQRVEHTFDTIGEHAVSVTVTSSDFDESGTAHETKTFTRTITVHEPGNLKNADAIIEASTKSGVAPLTVNFNGAKSGRASGGKIDRYEWLINDGEDKFYGISNVYRFEKAGDYNVLLKVIYDSGVTRTDVTVIHVTDATFAPTAMIRTTPAFSSFERSVVGPLPFTVSFDGSDSKDKDNNIVYYEWDFNGDGSVDAEGSSTEFKYTEEGTFRAKLTVTDADGGTDDATVTVTVDPELPTIDFGASAISGAVPFTVDFDASNSRMPNKKIVSYEWNFDTAKQGSFIANRAQTSHVFDKIGEYAVKLTLHADDGSTATDIMKIIATNKPLTASFVPSRITGPAPLSVSFNATQSTGTVVRGEWNFGDGTTSIEMNPTHFFTKPGAYTVTLQLFDRFNNTATDSRVITVE